MVLKLHELVNGTFQQLEKLEKAFVLAEKIFNQKDFDKHIGPCNLVLTVEVVRYNLKQGLFWDGGQLKISEWFLETSSPKRLADNLEKICLSNLKHRRKS